MNFYENLIETLKKNPEFVSEDGSLLKNKIIESAMKLDEVLINLLFENENIRERLFKKIDKTYVFDKVEFSWLINNREFLPDSYTRFKNKIGLSFDNEYLDKNTNVVLSFPFKDCVLEGGQSVEDQKREEVFYNEIISQEQITNLLSPKVITNIKKITKDGEQQNPEITEKDNLIIKGNNLLVLSSLLKKYEGKVDLINIDPPYNTGTDSFNYNDKFNHSTWLVFMKNRLELSKRLLKDTGSIYVQIDVKEAHYLKVLMDEVFGRENFRSEIIWDTSIPYVAGNKWLSNNWIYSHSAIFYYAKNKNSVFFKKQTFDVQQKSGDISKKPYKDVWCDIENFAGFLGAKDIKLPFNSRKPEKLIERIITSSCPEGGLVLDFFGGSGTTLASAHKMNRQYIGVEQMDSQIDIVTDRLKAVINGDDKGISKMVNWNSGGSFIYFELKENSAELINQITKFSKTEELLKIFDKLKKSSFVNFRVDLRAFESDIDEFKKLSIEEQKECLIKIIDKNMLYVNYSDIDDETFLISEEEKKVNKNFYEGE